MVQESLLSMNVDRSFEYRYFIFTSFWAYKIYYVYGFMLLVLIILSIVTACITIVCSYFMLNAEDYRWFVFAFFEMLKNKISDNLAKCYFL